MSGRQMGDAGGDHCWVDQVVWGGMVGGSLGIAPGVHQANRRRGALGNSALASLVMCGGGLLVAALADRPVLQLAIPVLQIAADLTLEREVRPARGGADPI